MTKCYLDRYMKQYINHNNLHDFILKYDQNNTTSNFFTKYKESLYSQYSKNYGRQYNIRESNMIIDKHWHDIEQADGESHIIKLINYASNFYLTKIEGKVFIRSEKFFDI